MDEFAKIFLLLTLSFVGGLVYIAVTRDLSPRALVIVGALGLASLLLGFLIGRENPNAIVHLLMVAYATVAIFAAIYWWYSRDQVAAVFALAATPPAVIFSGLTLLRRGNRQKAPGGN